MTTSYTRLYVHLIWGTFDRAPVLDARRARRVHGLLDRICLARGCQAYAVGGIEDHVHALVALHPSVAVADLVRALKVGTSQFVAHRLNVPGFSWQEGYGAYSIRDEDCETVREYIRNQPLHHAQQSLISALERTEAAATPRSGVTT
jgi:putative transposase